jgi:hypothetical protein
VAVVDPPRKGCDEVLLKAFQATSVSKIVYVSCNPATLARDVRVLTELGYELKIVYGDPYNDPAGNLQAVQNAMSGDVVGVIASQDGGVKAIMDEYPELYLVGFNTDMLSAFTPGGDNSAVLENDKFLGTIVDGFYDGALTGKQYAEAAIAQGYKKVSLVTFPPYAYPNLMQGCETFITEIAAYNATVADEEKIEVVGDIKVLEFAPLEEDYFLQDGMGELDAIIGLCAGVGFVYPTMVSAMSNGICSPETKLLTSGFESNPDMIADIGEEGRITFISVSPIENFAWAVIMLDNAITGNMYPDYTEPVRVNSLPYEIDSKEDIDNVMSKSIMGTLDVADASVSIEDVKNHLVRFNPAATYAELDAFFHSEQLSVDALINS